MRAGPLAGADKGSVFENMFPCKGADMRNAIKTVAAGAAIMLMTTAGSLAGPVSTPHPDGPALEAGVINAQWYGYSGYGGYYGGYGRYGYCARLRWRCQHKYELGQEGMGNCQRYREECGGGYSYCARLRWRCEHKYELGEVGQGNCQRYREECGGRRAY